MDREEILAKSREENHDRDLYEQEVMRRGWSLSAAVATVLGTLFFLLQIALGESFNYGIYAILLVLPATQFAVKAVKLRRRHEIVMAVVYGLAVLGLSVAHIGQLVQGAGIGA